MKQITCNFCGDTYPDFDVAHVCSKGPYAPRLKPKMNKRIGQLAEQAGLLGPTSRVGNSHEATEKFAELIVRECVGIADEYDGVGSTIVSRIEKHFGVAE
jgi:hypothetical protein